MNIRKTVINIMGPITKDYIKKAAPFPVLRACAKKKKKMGDGDCGLWHQMSEKRLFCTFALKGAANAPE